MDLCKVSSFFFEFAMHLCKTLLFQLCFYVVAVSYLWHFLLDLQPWVLHRKCSCLSGASARGPQGMRVQLLSLEDRTTKTYNLYIHINIQIFFFWSSTLFFACFLLWQNNFDKIGFGDRPR